MLVLGTMPSPVSRKNGFYYAHPRNRFWQVTALVFSDPYPVTFADKTALLKRHGIALWDVLARCDICGAADAKITRPVCNDFSRIMAAARITRVFTTGSVAYALYTRYCRNDTGIDAIKLPSPSPANARFTLEALVEQYKKLRSAG
jgi:hypoxanthine-DNA glycosylase